MPETVPDRDSEILHAESFFGGVYDKTSKWLEDVRGAQVIKTFDSLKVSEWERQATYPPGEITLGIDVRRAVLMRDSVNTYGIVIGGRKQSRYDSGKNPSLLFGFTRNSDFANRNYSADSQVQDLRTLLNRGVFNYRRAEFYFDLDFRKIETDCWIDEYQYGGEGLNKWDRNNKVLSRKGEKAIINTIKRLVRNYDPI